MSNLATTLSVAETVTSVTVAEEVTTINIEPATTTVEVKGIAISTANAAALPVTPHGTVTATNVQDAIEQLADQFFRGTTAPSDGTTNLSEGDLFYDTDDDQLKVYRETSANNFEFVPLASATGTMDNLDGGLF